MSNTDTPFRRHLLGNLRMSVIIIVIGLAGVALFALIAQEPVAWEIPVFLAVGMLLSSLLNAYIDMRRERGGSSR